MSLIKYTLFIDSLIVILRESGLCCSIGRIPSSPVGYADDLAACCVSERKLDGALKVVYQHGCKWRYTYNAKKSGIMVYGETPRANKHNSEVRVFKLGSDRVRERTSYDHVGVTACLFDEDISGITGRLSKARRALNAISGLGIRRNGLSVYTCNVIFWSIIVPIALFGCEVWILNDKAVEAVEAFQVYEGKRVQRLFRRSPNVCAFFGLGWIRLERLIEIKKLMFVRSILVLNVDDPSRDIFCRRLEDFLADRVFSLGNAYDSIVFDLLKTADTFGVLDEIVNMVRQGHFWPKGMWRKKLWERARALDAGFWRLEVRSYRNLDLLSGICDHPCYLVWWKISNSDHGMMRCCETMVKLLAHSSLLRVDDVRLKGRPLSARFCTFCQLAAPEDARHFVMECPRWQLLRNLLFGEITSIEDGSGQAILDAQCDVLLVLLGKTVEGFSPEQMHKVWCISARNISKMYIERIREGIG